MPTEGIHAENDADGGGNDGLHVGVHAHKGRTDALLTYGDEEVGDKGGANDEVSQLRHVGGGEGAIIEGKDLLSCKRQGEKCGEKEYPLHERDHRIAGNQGLEQSQVERKTEAIGYDEEDAHNACLTRRVGDGHTIEYQEDDAKETECHSPSLPHGDRLLQCKGGNEHREDGRYGAYDGAIHGSDVGDGHQEGYLCEEESKDRRTEYFYIVLPFDFLRRKEKRDEPKEQSRPY